MAVEGPRAADCALRSFCWDLGGSFSFEHFMLRTFVNFRLARLRSRRSVNREYEIPSRADQPFINHAHGTNEERACAPVR